MNKTTAIAILVALIIGVIMGSQIGCGGRAGGVYQTLHADTVIHYVPRRDTVWQTVEERKNIPYTLWGHDTVYQKVTERIVGRDTLHLVSYELHTDTVAYADTLRQRDAFMAEIFDTLYNNRIIARQVRWADLSPTRVETITNKIVKKPSLVKVYLGADAYGGKAGGKYNLDLAPATSVVIADRYMVDLGYYIFNQQITAGLKVKLSFRK